MHYSERQHCILKTFFFNWRQNIKRFPPIHKYSSIGNLFYPIICNLANTLFFFYNKVVRIQI